MELNRRTLLVGAGAAVAGAVFPLKRLFGRQYTPPGRWGPLRADPAGIFALPEGFSYRIVQRAHETMTDGYQVPESFDGMACFPGPNGTLVLMRNHENSWFRSSGPCQREQAAPVEAYDPAAQGGVTRVVLDEASLEVKSSNLVLAGTVRNCAGGPSPWGWLSCEETTEAGHGYVFRCRIDAERVRAPERIMPYGRFRHEAVAVDPETLVAYLTEDETDGCLYRFVPESRSDPFRGRLQALCLSGHPRIDTGLGLPRGPSVVGWVDIDDPDPKDGTVRAHGRARGAAIVRRGEGIWFHRGRVFVCSTSGGPRSAGQIFALDVGHDGPDHFELLAESSNTDVLNMPDNVTVAPWGDAFIAEDALGGHQHLRVLAPDGRLSDFGRNDKSLSELAGVCFSPDGRTLFVNLYGDGLTLGIRGPFTA